MHRNTLTILLYHGVAPKENRGIYNYRGKFIEPKHFERQIRYFAQHYTIVALDKGVQMLREGTLPKYALAVTFDDGYRNFYTYAFPVLKKLNIPATMFLATDFVLEKKPLWVDRLEYAMGKRAGSYGEKTAQDRAIRDALKKMPNAERESRLRAIEQESGVSFKDFEGERSVYAPLSGPEILEMQDAGITFGAHTKSHPILSRETPEQIKEEIRGSKIALERLCGKISTVFAYPNGQIGDWNEETERTVISSGFEAALTTIEGVTTRKTHPLRLKRITMDGTDDGPTFAVITSGVRAYLRRAKSYV